VIVNSTDVGGWSVIFIERVSDVVGAVVEVDFIASVAETKEVSWKGRDGIVFIDRSDVCSSDQSIEERSETRISNSGATVAEEVYIGSTLLLINSSKHGLGST
jgi:hypothetical protein